MTALLAFALGLFAFSFIEYFFHRWMFHTRVPLFEQGHRTHHEQPLGYDSLPFFLPAVVLLGLAGVFAIDDAGGFALLLARPITLGYIAYGLSHFTIHHVRFKQPLAAPLGRLPSRASLSPGQQFRCHHAAVGHPAGHPLRQAGTQALTGLLIRSRVARSIYAGGGIRESAAGARVNIE